MNDKLLPCPFCGSDYVRAIQTSTDAIVSCENCGARVGREENAKQIWNSRAETSVHRELAAYKQAVAELGGTRTGRREVEWVGRRVSELLAQEGVPAQPQYREPTLEDARDLANDKGRYFCMGDIADRLKQLGFVRKVRP